MTTKEKIGAAMLFGPILLTCVVVVATMENGWLIPAGAGWILLGTYFLAGEER